MPTNLFTSDLDIPDPERNFIVPDPDPTHVI